MDIGASSYRRFLDGDDSGFTEIVKFYKDGLILFLNGYVCNLTEAEDLVEDTFFKIMVKKPRYTETGSFKSWLYTIGKNLAINYLKYQSRHQQIAMEECEDQLQNESFEREYLRDEQKATVYHALKELKPDYRSILLLVYIENFSNLEAATIMKKSLRQIENLLYQAKRSLRSELEKEGFVYENL